MKNPTELEKQMKLTAKNVADLAELLETIIKKVLQLEKRTGELEKQMKKSAENQLGLSQVLDQTLTKWDNRSEKV